MKLCTGLRRRFPERLRGAKRVCRTVAARYDPTGARVRDGRNQSLQFLRVNQLLMSKAACCEIRYALGKPSEFLRRLRDKHLTMRLEPTAVVDDARNALPHFHRRDRQRKLCDMPCELTHAASIDAR